MGIDKAVLVQGARRGLWRAVMQGDCDLLKTCFGLLWGHEEGEQFIRWTVPSMVCQSAWYLLTEFVVFLDYLSENRVAVGSEQEGKFYKSFLYRLAKAPKSRDAFALALLSGDISEAPLSPVDKERHLFLGFRKTAEVFGLLAAGNDLVDTEEGFCFKDAVPLDDYSRCAVLFCRSRMLSGGLVFDRLAFLAALFLIGKRGLDSNRIREQWRTIDVKKIKPKEISLLELLFDNRTQFGRRAFARMEKRIAKIGLDSAGFYALWSRLEIDFTPKESLLKQSALNIQEADAFTTVWYLRAFKESIEFGQGAVENVRLWREDLRPFVVKIIRKLLAES